MKLCEAELYQQTRANPAEHCDNEAEPGSDYCEQHRHAGRDIWDDADDAYDRLQDERLGM